MLLHFTPSKTAELGDIYPYIECKHSSKDNSHPPPENDLRSANTCLIRSEALFRLGLVLTELSLGKSLMQLNRSEDSESDVVATQMTNAQRLLGHVYNESGSRYGDVVRRCLHCPFDVRDASLANEEFQVMVLDFIVSPLSEVFKDFSGTAEID